MTRELGIVVAGGFSAVVWPGHRGGDNHYVMRLFTSTTGDASFGGAVDVANLASGYAIGSNARVAVADDGQGWLTFRDSGGLEVADFSPVAPVPGPGPKPGPSETAQSKAIDSGEQQLSFYYPTACIGLGQRFSARVMLTATKKFNKRHPHSKLSRVSFFIDRGAKRTRLVGKGRHRHRQTFYVANAFRTHNPFKVTLSTKGLKKGTHTLRARVILAKTIKIGRHNKRITYTKTFTARITIC